MAIAVGSIAISGSVLRGQDSVTIQISGHYYAEPATVDVLVAVEPNKDNRTLRIEADSGNFYRSSDLVLAGDKEARYHTVMFKNVPAGQYVVRAVLYAGTREVAVAQTKLLVMDK